MTLFLLLLVVLKLDVSEKILYVFNLVKNKSVKSKKFSFMCIVSHLYYYLGHYTINFTIYTVNTLLFELGTGFLPVKQYNFFYIQTRSIVYFDIKITLKICKFYI